MFNETKDQNPPRTDTHSASEPARPYRKPQVHVIARTSDVLRGDYGANSDIYRSYQP